MIESFWQDMELDASRKLSAAASSRARTIRLWKVRHALFLVTGLLAFCTLVAGQLTSLHHDSALVPWLVGFTAATALTLLSGFAGHNESALVRIAVTWDAARQFLRRTIFADYLSPYFFLAVFLILVPTIALFVAILGPRLEASASHFTVPVAASADNTLRVLLTSLSTVAVAIIAAQVALFNFLFGQLLGKYTSGVVQTVIQHRAVHAARIAAFVFLALIMVALTAGVPTAYVTPFPYFQIVVIAIAFLCFICSIGIANSGVHAVHAIDLAGMQFAKEVQVAVPASIDPESRRHLWRVLNSVGLDWRDSRRFATIGQPKGGIDLTVGALQMLFGIAAKAIQDGQHDILLASCRAILRVATGYLQRRVTYIAADDGVFSYMNDQSAALVKTAVKSVNEYLVTDVVRLVGGLGLMSVSIGKLPASDSDTSKVNQSMQSHFLSAMWIGLLKEAVVATYNLERTHATGVAIDQMQSIALRLDQAGYDTPLAHTFLNEVEQVHALCIIKAEPYGVSLAARCVGVVMRTWSRVMIRTPILRGHGTFTVSASECLLRMAQRSFAAEKGAARMDLNDFTNIVTSRTSESAVLLHDLALTAISRNVERNSDRRAAAEDAIAIIELITALGKTALAGGIYNATNYLDSLYSLACSIVEDWPKQLDEVVAADDPYAATRRGQSNRERVEEKLFDGLAVLMDSLLQTEARAFHDWRHAMFSVVGLGMHAWKREYRDSLKVRLEGMADKYESHIMAKHASDPQSLHDEDFDYLQLLGAWLLHYFDDQVSAQRIANFVGTSRLVRDSMYGGGRGRLAYLGYPTLHYSDFGIKRFDNPSLSDDAIQRITQAAHNVISDQVLVPYGETIQAIQEPIREAYYARARSAREARRQRSGTSPPPSEPPRSSTGPDTTEGESDG